MAAGFPDGGGASYSPNWVRYIPAYLPLSSISSSWVPLSAIRPSSINRMRSVPDGGKPVGDNKGSPPTGECQFSLRPGCVTVNRPYSRS